MAFIKYRGKFKIGDRTKTTIIHDNSGGYFEVGTEVTIIGITERGYDIEDDEGNKVLEIGWIV